MSAKREDPVSSIREPTGRASVPLPLADQRIMPEIHACREGGSLSSTEWNYSSAMKIFHFGEAEPAPLTATGFVPMPPDRPLPGYLCQAARGMLDVSQAWLWQRASVSKKTINDFENGYASPKPALNLRIRRTLEQAGAQFIHGEDVVGVVVYALRRSSPR